MADGDDQAAKVDLGVDTLGVSDSLQKASQTTQLEDRGADISVDEGITPPYDPARLAALQELNGTHAVAVTKKASREVGFGFHVAPHPRVDSPAEDQRERLEQFWFGRDSIWKIGPQGTPAASPTEVFEMARQDWHGIGWLAIEILYDAEDEPRGLAHLPAKSVRVRGERERREGTVGHGYVQKRGQAKRFFAEAGARFREDAEGGPVYVDARSGEVADTKDGVNTVANELIFVPNPSPLSLYYGIPTWVAEVQTMMSDHEAKRFNREFFEYDAMPQYAVIVEGGELTKEARQDVRDMITNLRDQEGRRVLVLEAEDLAAQGIDVEGDSPEIRIEPLSQQGDEDMSFSDFREMNEHEVAKVHEVPPQLVGRMGNSNRSNIREAIRDFTKEVIEPRQERFAGRLYRILHATIMECPDWTLNFETRGAENERENAEVGAAILDSAGDAITVSEAREIQGLDPQPEWMDDALANTLLSELVQQGGGGGPGAMLNQELEEIENSVRREARTEARIRRGAGDD